MELKKDDLISRAAMLRLLDENGVVFRGEIEKLPAMEAVPVVHARWVDEDFPYKDANANQRVTAICSVCGNVAHRMEHGYSILSKFCPACGARMDGDADG